ncbi:hypothetical protein EC18_09850 [Salmonella enterica subsp. enterica serovar Bareilly str. CFSAN000215]|nr:hypothetical protein EC08_21590 [Salmonella enterica subsp. enterica serovar Bareilly str. CFSAN000221]KFT48517.1 hypothetical protein EC18_09850 [Salmonella enterica subsp. enterica serovar Bareilly str. CFSAN000215]KFU32437.1 hypothetical protein SEEB0188_22585 [Salmonella enterica subsp. enterica serovar Bareilly str. CFSAN000188]KFU35244.1 hypothetical protein EB98_21195 [Salmonella enterica subsp. enterica serovar Bareilly str. CFSAN000190]
MLRTEPAALSLPGPFGAAGFHPTVVTSTAGLLLAATVPVTPPLARRFLRFSHPGGKAAGL